MDLKMEDGFMLFALSALCAMVAVQGIYKWVKSGLDEMKEEDEQS